MDGTMMVGEGDKFSFEGMRPEERAIICALEEAHRAGQDVLRIAQIMEANGWDMVDEHECPEAHCQVCAQALRLGNSKVRNNLRRLMKHGMITRPADGAYALVRETASQVEAVEPEVVAIVEPEPAPVIEPVLVQIRCNPRELNEDETFVVNRVRTTEDPMRFKMALKLIEDIKRMDCSFYSACLDQAISGKWEGFSCASCTAYSAPDQDQQVSDVLALRAMQTASDELWEHGKVNRVRGVKPGADAKRTVVEDES